MATSPVQVALPIVLTAAERATLELPGPGPHGRGESRHLALST